MFRFKNIFFKREKKKKQEEEEEEEGRSVSDGPKSNQRPGSACSQTDIRSSGTDSRARYHMCSLNNLLRKK